MKVYTDTNFLVTLLAGGPFDLNAQRLHSSAASQNALPFITTFLGRLEFINALQHVIYSSRRGVPGIVITPEMAVVTESLFFNKLEEGTEILATAIPEIELEFQFQTLVHHHTAKEGFRTYDVLHVASAMVLGCDTFWSFDARAKRLAQLAGLAVN